MPICDLRFAICDRNLTGANRGNRGFPAARLGFHMRFAEHYAVGTRNPDGKQLGVDFIALFPPLSPVQLHLLIGDPQPYLPDLTLLTLQRFNASTL